MKKMSLFLFTATLSMLNTSVQASAVQDLQAISVQDLSPKDMLLGLINGGAAANFNAINHTVITEAISPQLPSPGDTFVTKGYGVLTPSFSGMELTYEYSISGTFTSYDQAQGKLFFNHGSTGSGAINQLTLYLDSDLNTSTLNADQDMASSYTDGVKIATMDLVADSTDEGVGYIQERTGTGKDIVTFKLSDEYMEEYGFSSNTVLLNKITSDISLADFVDGFPQAFDFSAFSGCGPLTNPYDSCSREIGTSELVLSSVPVPASLGLFLSGFGLLGWLKKRK